jgi:hypothetical protein
MQSSGVKDTAYLRIGNSIFSKIKTPEEYRKLLKTNVPTSDPLIIKADWVGMEEGNLRNFEALRCVAEATDGKVIVTEGHLLWRKRYLDPEGIKFNVDGKERNWDWLLKGKGWTWLIKQKADWSFFIKGPHWSQIKKEETLWLENHGFTDLFNDYDIEYINATDEIWSRNVVDSKIIKEAVESKYPATCTEKFYGFMPTKLYKHRGSTLISLSKRKNYQSFTMKNHFGLIPDPVRAWWHGYVDKTPDGVSGKRKNKSILDINKIYGAFFNMVGIFEAPQGDKSQFVRDVGISSSIAQLDAILNRVCGFNPEEATYLEKGKGMFGSYNDEMLDKAEIQLNNWFSVKEQ